MYFINVAYGLCFLFNKALFVKAFSSIFKPMFNVLHVSWSDTNANNQSGGTEHCGGWWKVWPNTVTAFIRSVDVSFKKHISNSLQIRSSPESSKQKIMQEIVRSIYTSKNILQSTASYFYVEMNSKASSGFWILMKVCSGWYGLLLSEMSWDILRESKFSVSLEKTFIISLLVFFEEKKWQAATFF